MTDQSNISYTQTPKHLKHNNKKSVIGIDGPELKVQGRIQEILIELG